MRNDAVVRPQRRSYERWVGSVLGGAKASSQQCHDRTMVCSGELDTLAPNLVAPWSTAGRATVVVVEEEVIVVVVSRDSRWYLPRYLDPRSSGRWRR